MADKDQGTPSGAEYFTRIIHESDETVFQTELTQFLNDFVERAGAELVSLNTSVVQQMSGLHFVAVVVIRASPNWRDQVTQDEDGITRTIAARIGETS